jgi:hypothetical protein
MNKCKHIKTDGESCQAIAMKGSDYCFSHNPDTQIEKHLAVVKGGLNSKKVNLDLEPLSIKTPQEVSMLLEDTINGVRSGELPPNIANTIGYLAGHALKALETADLQEKVTELEAVIMGRRKIK